MNTRRAIRIGCCGILLVVLIVYANMAGGFLPWFLLYVYFVLWVYVSCISFYGLKSVHTERIMSEKRVQSGGTLRVRIKVKRTTPLPVPWVRVKLDIPRNWFSLTRRAEGVIQLIFSRESELDFEFEHAERGVYSIGSTMLETGDVFGLISTKRASTEWDEVIVHPGVVPVSGWLGGADRAGLRQSSGRITNEAASVFGVRDYVPGDKLSRIHWGATARTGRLQSKAFELYVASELVFVPDLSASSFEADDSSSVFELQMTILASLMKYAYDGRKTFSSTYHGSYVTRLPKGCSDILLLRNLDVMAGAAPEGAISFPNTLHRLSQEAEPGTTMVVVSPCLTRTMAITAATVHRRTPVEWFVPNPQMSLSGDLQNVVHQLQASGVHVHIIGAPHDLSQLAQGGTMRGTRH